jgi:hypothetical protein
VHRRGLGRSALHVRLGGWHLAGLAAVGRGLALGALQERRHQRLSARGVAALKGHGALGKCARCNRNAHVATGAVLFHLISPPSFLPDAASLYVLPSLRCL